MGIILCIAAVALLGTPNTPNPYNDLLPRPQQVEIHNDVFTLPETPLGYIVQAPDKEAGGRLEARLREVRARLARLRESHGF